MIAAAGGGQPPPFPREFRYSRKAKARDVLVAVALSGIPGAILFVVLQRWVLVEDPSVWAVLACWALLAAPAVLVLGLWRWRDGARAGEEGLLVCRGGVTRSLSWDAVEEVRWLGDGGFEVRGAGEALRIARDLEGAADLLQETMRRIWRRVLTRMREELAQGRTLVFPGGAGGWEAAWDVLLPAAFLSTLVLSVVSGVLQAPVPWPAVLAVRFLYVALGVAFLAWIARRTWIDWGWRRGFVELSRDTLLLRGLGRPRRIPLEEVLRIDDTPKGRVFRLKDGKALRLPAYLLNYPFLEQLLRDRLKC